VLAVVAAYARLLVWPIHLSADYSFPQVPLATSPADPRVLAGIAVLAIAGGLAAWGWVRQQHVCFAIAFAALTFAVVSKMPPSSSRSWSRSSRKNPSMRVGLVTFLRAAGREREARAAQADAERLFPGNPDNRQLRQPSAG
jgi:hypothetical protein